MPKLPEAEGQMSDPLICCITLDPGGRPDFTRRYKKCIEEQVYVPRESGILYTAHDSRTIGSLRNTLLDTGVEPFGKISAPFVAHFDWDDWSAPDRLSIQLDHIQKTGKLVTGFHDMPMYDAKNDKVWFYRHHDPRYALGTSLFYRREAWERVKFPDKTPEDNQWRREVGLDNCLSQSSLREDGTPIMIQTVHGGNASARIVPSNHTKFQEADEKLEKAVREILAHA